MNAFVKLIDYGPSAHQKHFWSIASGRYYASVLLNDGPRQGFGTAYDNCPCKAECKALKKARKNLKDKEYTADPITKSYQVFS